MVWLCSEGKINVTNRRDAPEAHEVDVKRRRSQQVRVVLGVAQPVEVRVDQDRVVGDAIRVNLGPVREHVDLGRGQEEPPRPVAVGASIYDARRTAGTVRLPRSEEHTSELQSLAYLVCRLL